MNVVGLQDTAHVGLVRGACSEPLDRRFLVAERLQESEGEFATVERLLCECRDGFLNLDGVHVSDPRSRDGRSPIGHVVVRVDSTE